VAEKRAIGTSSGKYLKIYFNWSLNPLENISSA